MGRARRGRWARREMDEEKEELEKQDQKKPKMEKRKL
jgi:hypothetical protein